MHEIGPFIGALRRRMRFLVPRKWLASHPKPRLGLRARRPSRARFELDAASPATSWVAWEISRRGRPAGTESSRPESEQ
jgi:hypothetical protein